MTRILLALIGVLVMISVASAAPKNMNTNKNININKNTATATATAVLNAQINVKNNISSGGGAGGGPWADIPQSFGQVSTVQPFIGSGGGVSGGGITPDLWSAPTWGVFPNTLDLSHPIVRSMPSNSKKWAYDLSCRDGANMLAVKFSTDGDGDMSITETDGGGITWDRFEMYNNVALKKINDNQWEWSGTRANVPGVKLTGDVMRDPDKNTWRYVERQNVGGGTRDFTNASCKLRQ
jgi:hypothetical protein